MRIIIRQDHGLPYLTEGALEVPSSLSLCSDVHLFDRGKDRTRSHRRKIKHANYIYCVTEVNISAVKTQDKSHSL